MAVKITVVGNLAGPIRQYEHYYVFEVEGPASKSVPKGLPLPTDTVASVILNEKQLKKIRTLIEAGDRVIVQGEPCGDVPVRHIEGELAVVALSVTTASLEAGKRNEGAADQATPPAPPAQERELPPPAPDRQDKPPLAAAAAPAPVVAPAPKPSRPRVAVGTVLRMRLADIVIAPALHDSHMNPEKTAAARRELQAGIMPGPLEVADVDGQVVLQDGYRRWLLLQEAGHTEYEVVFTDRVLFRPDTRTLPRAQGNAHEKAQRTAAAPAPQPAAPKPQAPAPAGLLEWIHCERCTQLMQAKLRQIVDGQGLCPDCAAGRPNPVTTRTLPAAERGFPPTAEAAAQMAEITGVPEGDALIQARLLTVFGCLYEYERNGTNRRYHYKGLNAAVANGQIYQVRATKSAKATWPTLAHQLEKCRSIDEADASATNAGGATAEVAATSSDEPPKE